MTQESEPTCPAEGQIHMHGPSIFAHELRASLRRLEEVEMLDLEPGQQAGDPSYNVEVDEFGLNWILPCHQPGTGTVDPYLQPFSNLAQGNSPPPGALPGALPLDGVARDIANTLFQQVIRAGFHTRDTCPWYCDHLDGRELIAYKMGGYTFVLAIGPATPGATDKVLVSGRIYVDVAKLDPIAGRHV